jgi:hypothetical protein
MSVLLSVALFVAGIDASSAVESTAPDSSLRGPILISVFMGAHWAEAEKMQAAITKAIVAEAITFFENTVFPS